MKNFIITLAVLLIIFVPAVFAQQYDSPSLSSRYEPYSADNINNPYSPINQYSTDNINNPYSPANQYSLRSGNYFPIQQEHDWHAAQIIAPEQIAAEKAEKAEKAKEAAEEALARKFFGDGKPKKQIPVFYYLLALSSLAIGATVLIIVGSFKK